MDFDPKYRENNSSSQSLFFHDNFPKCRDDQFSLDGVSSSKDTSFLQDLHPFENFNLNGSSSSSTPMFWMQPTCLDAFDNSSLEGLQSFDFYESKPLTSNHGGGGNNNASLIPLMDDFNNHQANGVMMLGHSQMVTPINMINTNSSFQNHNLHFNYYDLGPTKYLPADEGSCTSLKNDMAMVTKNLMVKKGARGRKKKSNVVKGQWTIEEDRLLVKLVERYGVRKWSQIAQMLNGRIGKQCRERWHNHLRPDIKKDVWSEEEDRILINAHAEIGNKWAEIAKRLPGRTENSIKNHWNATKRRQFARRKCRSKYPRQSSLLQEYIKSLSPEVINAGCRKKPISTSSITTSKSSSNPKNNHNNNNSNNSNNNNATQTGSSESESSEELNVEAPPDYDFSDVPDFNFDAHMFDDSSFDSLLEGASNNDNDDGAIVVYHDDQGKTTTSSENLNLNQTQIDLGSMIQCEVKKEMDLVEMINQVNL